MEMNANPEKVTGLWTVTRNGPTPSGKWLVEMYIWTCWLPPHLSDAQRRGRTTHWVYRLTEAMAAAVARRGRAHGACRAISVANIDRKVTHFYKFSVG